MNVQRTSHSDLAVALWAMKIGCGRLSTPSDTVVSARPCIEPGVGAVYGPFTLPLSSTRIRFVVPVRYPQATTPEINWWSVRGDDVDVGRIA